MTESASIEPDALLRETRWLQALAESIVHDEHAAEDLVQTTFLQALAHPPREAGALRAWLARVATRLAYRAGDRARWRDRWEESGARREAEPSTFDLVARASLHRTLVDAVLGLEEPQRSAVLMRFFDDRPPREIAERQGVPVATVRSRIRRALERLREELDRTQGGREGWMSALGIPAVPIAAAASAGAATVLVATKAKIAAAAAIILVAGAFGWRWTHPPDSPPEPDRGSVGRGAGPMAAAAPAAQDAGRDAAPPTRPIVARRVSEPEDRSGSANARIVGEIVDDDTGKPLEGAEVSVSRTADGGLIARTLTETDGSFALPTSSMVAWTSAQATGSSAPPTSSLDWTLQRLTIAARDRVRWEYPSSDWRAGPASRRSGRDVDFGTIRIERGAVVTGRVILAGDRRPVAGAALFLRTGRGGGPLDALSAVGTSADDGRFALPERLGATGGDPPPFLIAVHPAGLDWVRLPVVKGQERVSFEILARDGRSATVRTLDAGGRPLEGALVLAMPAFAPFGDATPFKGCPERPELPAAGSPLAAFASRILRVTGADGAASFSGLPEGRDDPWFGPSVANRIVFCAFREGFEAGRAELDLESRTESVTIALTPLRERAITGVVRDESGSPVAGASVSYANRPPPVLTNSAGEYRLPADLPRADQPDAPVAATAPGFAWAMRYATITPGEPDPILDFRLVPAVPVRVRLVDETGHPFPGVSVMLYREAEGRTWYLPMEGRNATEEDGIFMFSKSDAGPWTLLVPSSGGWEPVWPRTVFGGESVEIVLRRPVVGRASVTAEVVDESTGEPVAVAGGAVLPAFARPGDWSRHILTEMTLGRVSAKEVPPGTWKLFVGALGYSMNDQQFTVRADEAITLRIVLARPGVLVARVVPDGSSAASRPEVWPVSVGDFQARWVSEPGKPVPGVPRGSGRADAAHGWTCRFEDLRSNAAVRCWTEGAGMFDETFVKIGPGEEKTIELRPRATGVAKLETSRKAIGWVIIEVADDTGGWHHVANQSLARLEGATFEITRPAGAFRWRARLWPIDSPGTNPPKTAEGEAKIEAGKTTAIVVDLPE